MVLNIFDDLGLVIDLFASILKMIWNIVTNLDDVFLNGIQFFVSTFTNIPNFIFDILYELPVFYRNGLIGIFGLLLFILTIKIISLLKLK